MKFVDRAKIFVRSGNGGRGCISFLREKFREFGGPDGGEGGHGGSVYVEGDLGMNTLYDLKLNPHLRAGNGNAGMGRNKTGHAGEDKVIAMPLGTVIIDTETEEIMLEVVDTERKLLLKGGRGGKGNKFFHSRGNRLPYIAQPGESGVEKVFLLELKVIADIGLVGFPNAGKSTLIKAVTNADPKIADYPFTTLTPNLGVMDLANFRRVVIADIPGIIEGASDGAGLGLEFLRHIERTKVLAFLIDISHCDKDKILSEYATLNVELEKYSTELVKKRRTILFTKLDLLPTSEEGANRLIESLQKKFARQNITVIALSAVTGKNLERLGPIFAELIPENLDAKIVSATREPKFKLES